MSALTAEHLQLLRWLLDQPCSGQGIQAFSTKLVRSGGRLLMLVHGHGWVMPGRMCKRLKAIEQRHEAFNASVLG